MRTARTYWCLILIIMFSTLVSGCNEAPPGETTIWMDAPLPGGQVKSGDEVLIQTHAYSPIGIAEIEFIVDGMSISRNVPDPAGEDLVTLAKSWIATTPGMHTLQVTAYNRNGVPSSPAVVMIEVLGEKPPATVPPAQAAAQAPTETPPPTVTVTTTLTAAVTPTVTVTLPTPTHTASPTSTMVLPPSITFFTADSTSIQAGECTSLRWQAQNAESVTLDGGTVGSTGSRQVCPQQTTLYTLWAISPAGARYQTIQVFVTIPPPPDKSGPIISNLSVNPGVIYDNPSCGTDRAYITAAVTDNTSGVREVEIFFRVVKPPTQAKSTTSGELVSLKMLGAEIQGFYIYLGSAELSRSLELYGGGTVQYYLVATDQAGNTTQSPTYTFQTEICIF